MFLVEIVLASESFDLILDFFRFLATNEKPEIKCSIGRTSVKNHPFINGFDLVFVERSYSHGNGQT